MAQKIHPKVLLPPSLQSSSFTQKFMSGTLIGMILLAAFGFLPLGIVLYKVLLVRRIMKYGQQAKARVYEISSTRSYNHDMRSAMRRQLFYVHYTFYGNGSQQYSGMLTIAEPKYSKGDVIDIYYLPENPKRNTVKGAWKSAGMLIFTVLLALFVIFAAYKIYRMIEFGEYE